MNHIDVFIYQTILSKTMPGFTKENLRVMFANEFQIPLSLKDMDNWAESLQPKKGQIARRLAELGYSPYAIGEMLEVNHSTVSYHLNKENTKEYINPRIRNTVNEWRDKTKRVFE